MEIENQKPDIVADPSSTIENFQKYLKDYCVDNQMTAINVADEDGKSLFSAAITGDMLDEVKNTIAGKTGIDTGYDYPVNSDEWCYCTGHFGKAIPFKRLTYKEAKSAGCVKGCENLDDDAKGMIDMENRTWLTENDFTKNHHIIPGFESYHFSTFIDKDNSVLVFASAMKNTDYVINAGVDEKRSDEPGFMVVSESLPDCNIKWMAEKEFNDKYELYMCNTISGLLNDIVNKGTERYKQLESLDVDRSLSNASSDVRSMIEIQSESINELNDLMKNAAERIDGNQPEAPVFSFGIALKMLEHGHLLCRSGWNGKNLVVFKQVPNDIGTDTIPNMKSLPADAKNHIMNTMKRIDYTSQCLIYNGNTGRADSWVPSVSDIFAKDWMLAK